MLSMGRAENINSPSSDCISNTVLLLSFLNNFACLPIVTEFVCCTIFQIKASGKNNLNDSLRFERNLAMPRGFIGQDYDYTCVEELLTKRVDSFHELFVLFFLYFVEVHVLKLVVVVVQQCSQLRYLSCSRNQTARNPISEWYKTCFLSFTTTAKCNSRFNRFG